ncbi:MAG: hypothetical protein ABIR57_00505, partial [Aeromicrobium sp.]
MRVGLRVLTPLIALLAVTAVACGSQPETHPNDHGKKGPITARALAAIVQDHLSDQMGKATSARPELDGPRAVGGVGTEVRFRAKGEPVAPAVSVSVGSKASAAKFTC